MTQRVLLLLAGLVSMANAGTTTSASATSTVIDIHLPTSVDSEVVMGSIMGVDATATSYFVTCPTTESSLDCGFGSGLEIVDGPAVLEVHMTESAIGTIDVSCAITSDTATCTTSMTRLDYDISGTSTSSTMVTSSGSAVVTGISSYTLPLTVTAGLDKLAASTTGSTSGSTSGSTAGSTSSSTGGVPRMTQNAVFMGAAAMVGGALLM